MEKTKLSQWFIADLGQDAAHDVVKKSIHKPGLTTRIFLDNNRQFSFNSMGRVI